MNISPQLNTQLPPIMRSSRNVRPTSLHIDAFTANNSRIETVKIPEAILVSAEYSMLHSYYGDNIILQWCGVSAVDSKLESYKRLAEISALKDDWNGNGAAQFSEKIIRTMRGIVDGLKIQPSIFPTARESIQFEYENDSGDYLEFELFENGTIKTFFYSADGKTWTNDILESAVDEKVKAFYERKV